MPAVDGHRLTGRVGWCRAVTISGPRFLFYTNELVGFGHLRRQLALADRLATTVPGATSLIVTGSPVEPYFRFPPGVDAVQLPTRTRDEDGKQTGALRVGLDELQELRSRIALAAALAFRPVVLVVDKLPFGPTGELLPTLEAVRASSTCKMVLGLRDIDDSPERVRAQWSNARRELIERYFDAILVYGPPSSPDALDCLGWEDLRVPVAHVGYAGAILPTATPRSLPSGYVLVTAGSGRSGFRLLSTYLEALALDPPPCHSIVLTGPLMEAQEKAQLHRLAAGVDAEVWEFRTDIGGLVAGSVGIVSMAGYNTVVEAIRAGKPALFVPRVRPGEEQLTRARFLAERGMASWIHPDDLSPASMRAGLEELLARPVPSWNPDEFLGTERSAEILAGLASGTSRDTAWSGHAGPKPVGEFPVPEPAAELALAVWAYGSTGLAAPPRDTTG